MSVDRLILEDAITTCDNFSETFEITDKSEREAEQREFIARIKNDIQTVLRGE